MGYIIIIVIPNNVESENVCSTFLPKKISLCIKKDTKHKHKYLYEIRTLNFIIKNVNQTTQCSLLK